MSNLEAKAKTLLALQLEDSYDSNYKLVCPEMGPVLEEKYVPLVDAQKEIANAYQKGVKDTEQNLMQVDLNGYSRGRADAQEEIEKALEEQAKAIHEDWNRAGREWHQEERELKAKIEAANNILKQARDFIEAIDDDKLSANHVLNFVSTLEEELHIPRNREQGPEMPDANMSKTVGSSPKSSEVTAGGSLDNPVPPQKTVKLCVICQKQKPTDFEGYCQSCHDEIAARNVREGTKENTTP
jgi:hypothetical protein